MPIELIDLGEIVTLRALFINSSGSVADPTGGTLVITLPDGTTVTRLITTQTTADGTGRWHYDYTTTQNGMHTYVWSPTGPVSGIQAGEFLVGSFTSPGPCSEWAGVESIFDCSPCASVAAADRDYGSAADALQAATRILYEMTARRYPGLCRHVVRPCRWSDRWGSAMHPSHNWGSCTCGAASPRECGCPAGPVVVLPDWPVMAIDSVRVDGSLVASSSYRLDEQRLLRRIDDDTWPSCQDLTANPASENATFQVTYWAGVLPPPDGVLAVRRLACELYQACSGGDCALPDNITNLARLGMSVDFADIPTVLAEENYLGIREVDWFLKAERYGRSHGNVTTVSVDRPHAPGLRVY